VLRTSVKLLENSFKLKIIDFVFSSFNKKLFAWNQAEVSLKASCAITLPKTFIYIKKSNGSRTEPCGTPHVTARNADHSPPEKTACFRFSK